MLKTWEQEAAVHCYELVLLKMEQPNRPFPSPVSHLFEVSLHVCVKQMCSSKDKHTTCSVAKAAGAGLEEILAGGIWWCC